MIWTTRKMPVDRRERPYGPLCTIVGGTTVPYMTCLTDCRGFEKGSTPGCVGISKKGNLTFRSKEDGNTYIVGVKRLLAFTKYAGITVMMNGMTVDEYTFPAKFPAVIKVRRETGAVVEMDDGSTVTVFPDGSCTEGADYTDEMFRIPKERGMNYLVYLRDFVKTHGIQ